MNFTTDRDMKASKGQYVDDCVHSTCSRETLPTNTELQGDTGWPAGWETSSSGLSEEYSAPMMDWNLFVSDWTPPQASHVKHVNTSNGSSSPQPPTSTPFWTMERSESHDGAQSQWSSASTPDSNLLHGLCSFEDYATVPWSRGPCHSLSESRHDCSDDIMCPLLPTLPTHMKTISTSKSSMTPAVPCLRQSVAEPRVAKQHGNRRVAKQDRPFHCTFCSDSFKTKYDWSRHEKSRHFSLDYWVCTPHGGVVQCAFSGQSCCAYCNTPEPSQAHLQSHNDGFCKFGGQSKLFSRRDHLIQHLRHVHGLSDMSASLDDWKIVGPALVSRCGFCSHIMESWSERVNHIAKHFKQGKTREDWHGDLGLGSR